MRLAGQVALVTGAARRVGRAIALALAEAGCDIALHFNRSRDDAHRTAADIEALGRRCWPCEADLADADAAAALPDRVAQQAGRLDILIHNASTWSRTPLTELTLDAWERVFRVNVFAAGLLARSAAKHLRQSGRGRIVNISDIAAGRPWGGYLAYCASKAALENLTRGLARALAPEVLVNAVAPGIVEFPPDLDEATRRRLIGAVPLRRCGAPADVAATVLFLVRDADYVTGTTIAVDGGREIAWGAG